MAIPAKVLALDPPATVSVLSSKLAATKLLTLAPGGSVLSSSMALKVALLMLTTGASFTGSTVTVSSTAWSLLLYRLVPPVAPTPLRSMRLSAAGRSPWESSTNRTVRDPAWPFQSGAGMNEISASAGKKRPSLRLSAFFGGRWNIPENRIAGELIFPCALAAVGGVVDNHHPGQVVARTAEIKVVEERVVGPRPIKEVGDRGLGAAVFWQHRHRHRACCAGGRVIGAGNRDRDPLWGHRWIVVGEDDVEGSGDDFAFR